MLTGVDGGTTGSGHVEVHCLYAASNFQTRLDVATPWAYLDTADAPPLNRLPFGGLAPPLVMTSSLAEAEAGVPYSRTLSALNGGRPYEWSRVAGALPPGLSLSGTGVIHGTPTSSGTYSFTVLVTDTAGATASKSFTLTVAKPVAVSTTTLPSGLVGHSYRASVAGTGGIPPYAWSRISGTKPPGLTFSASGVWSGTPTKAGSYSFTVRVTDKDGKAASRTLKITIES